MADLFAAIGLLLVIEGVLYAAFPDGMKQMVRMALDMPPATMRAGGLGAAVLGLAVIWLVRG